MPALRPSRALPRPLRDVAAWLGLSRPSDAGTDALVTGVTHDSRGVLPGDLYAALPGARAHGASFAAEAVRFGAVAVLTDPAGEAAAGEAGAPVLVVADPRGRLGELAAWINGDPSDALELVGVTGTNGKTTTAYLIEAAFRAAGRTTGLIGTVETRIAGEPLASAFTTPEAPDLQALLAVMAERGVQSVAMEVSSHGLALGRVDGVHYQAAVFTNLTQDHLDFHDGLEDYYAAKASLFRASRCGRAVVNVDDAWGRRLVDTTDCPVTRTSTSGRPADWTASDIALSPAGTSFRLRGPEVDRAVTMRLTGAFNVANALGAVAAVTSIGIAVDDAVHGIADLAGVPGRLERVDAGQGWLAVVDYAHTPDSVATVLRTLRPVTEGRLLVVLGCGGDRDKGKRPLMGAAAAEGADVVIVTSDNPRSEDPAAIIAAVAEGARAAGAGQLFVEPDRAAAIALACGLAQPSDTVVVAGKGHEQGQIFGDRTVPFDDRVVLREAIGAAVAS